MDMIIVVSMTIVISLISFFSGLYVNRLSNNGIIFGVRVPREYEKDSDILKLENQYKKFYLIFNIPIILIINIIVILYPKISLFTLLTLLLVVVTNIPIFVYWKKMSRLKEEKGWRKLGKNVVVVDTSIRKPKKKEDFVGVRSKTYLLLLIIPIITFILTLLSYKNVPELFPIHYNAQGVADSFVEKSGFRGFFYLALFPVLIQVGMILFLLAMNKFAINGKSEINGGTLEEIKKQRRIFKRFNSIFLFIITLEITILFALIQFCTLYGWSINKVNIISLTVIFITVIVFLVISYKIGQGGKNIKIKKIDEEIYRDDDKHWLLGNFYYNKNDPSIFVEKRIGIGLGKNVVVVDTSIRKPKKKEDFVGVRSKTYLLLLIIPIITFILTLLSYKNVPELFPIHYNAQGVADSFVEKSGFRGFFYLALFPVLIQVGMILFLLAMNKFAINGKSEINGGTLEEIKKQRRIFKRFNSIFLFIITLEITILFALIQFCTLYGWSINKVNIISLTVIFITVIVFLVISYKIGQGGKNIKIKKIDEEIYRDDDKHWLLGNFYYNKNDPSIFVEKRIGIGWDVNLGNPIGMIIMILPIILVLVAIICLAIRGI